VTDHSAGSDPSSCSLPAFPDPVFVLSDSFNIASMVLQLPCKERAFKRVSLLTEQIESDKQLEKINTREKGITRQA
jgi:hypothetical protein